MLGFAHDYDKMRKAPDANAYIEVMNQYERAGGTAKRVTSWIRDRGHVAEAKTGPMTEDVLMIPAAIEAGLGELGKHGSIINRTYGSSFRLAMVTTDLPLIADQPDVFGGDMFCESCQLCSNACPARCDLPREADGPRRAQMVRRLRQMCALFRRPYGLRVMLGGLPMVTARRRR